VTVTRRRKEEEATVEKGTRESRCRNYTSIKMKTFSQLLKENIYEFLLKKKIFAAFRHFVS